jgi:predicted heme/steroid binding protein
MSCCDTTRADILWTTVHAQVRLLNAEAFRNEGTMTLASLGGFNGSGTTPLYFGCRGNIYDASESEAFRKQYSAWAGKDATYALATMSLEPQDAGKTSACLSDCCCVVVLLCCCVVVLLCCCVVLFVFLCCCIVGCVLVLLYC